MDDLIAQITEKTGVTAEKAKEMVGVTADWVKSRVPEDVADQFGSILSGAGDIAGSATEAASGAAAAATGKAGELWHKAKDTVSGRTPGKDE